jgi:hypothetical protein
MGLASQACQDEQLHLSMQQLRFHATRKALTFDSI